MAIESTLITNTDTTILSVPVSAQYAITSLMVCNYANTASSTSDSSFDMHLLKGSGAVKSDTNKVLNNISMPAQETFTFSLERIVLDEGDSVVLVSADADKLTATISYLEV
jgi:hypothetical protein